VTLRMQIKSNVGKCALCDQIRRLEKSHIIPQGCYSRLRDGAPFTVNVVGKSAFPSQKQLHARLLCKACEELFDKHGEKFFFRNCLQNDGSFPVFTRGIEHISELVTIGDQKAGYWPSASLGVPPEKLAYFAASLFWRTWAAKERLPRDRISIDLQPEVIEGLRDFLLSRSATIANAALVANLVGRTPQQSIDLRYVFSLPQEITRHDMGTDIRFYNTECLGFVFFLISAPEPMLTYARTNCILHNESHPIFVGEGIQQGSIKRQYAWVGGSTPTESLKTWHR